MSFARPLGLSICTQWPAFSSTCVRTLPAASSFVNRASTCAGVCECKRTAHTIWFWVWFWVWVMLSRGEKPLRGYMGSDYAYTHLVAPWPTVRCAHNINARPGRRRLQNRKHAAHAPRAITPTASSMRNSELVPRARASCAICEQTSGWLLPRQSPTDERTAHCARSKNDSERQQCLVLAGLATVQGVDGSTATRIPTSCLRTTCTWPRSSRRQTPTRTAPRRAESRAPPQGWCPPSRSPSCRTLFPSCTPPATCDC